VVFFGVLAALFLLAVACSQGQQSTWDAVGPVAEKQLQIFNVILWVMVAVFVLVEGTLLYTLIRYRRRPGQPKPPQIHGHTALEITWTVIPTFLVLGLGFWSVFTLFDLDEPPDDGPEILHVNVTGHQWFFEFEYPDAGGGKRITTANELRIPVDRPIRLNLESDDVLHSFWVPKLAGKVDMIPTRTNHMWFQADREKIDEELPATFFGQCAELCGIAHALMRFRVTVMDQVDFDSWVEAYGPPPTITEGAKRGQQIFNVNCSLCHTISGPDDPGLAQSRLDGFLTGGDIVPVPAPNLTDLRTRHTLGAGIAVLSADNLRKWITNPEDIKQGNLMSKKALLYQNGDANLSDADIDALIEYLLNVR
jgi:cytochrome c oxidase subunit 2